MSDARHDDFAAAAAAYALDALTPDERRAFEAHLATCAECQADVASFRGVSVGIGLATDPVDPPSGLKARVIARATGQAAVAAPAPTPARVVEFHDRRSPSSGWLAAAAGLLLAAASGMYAWSLHTQLESVRSNQTEAARRESATRAEIASLRQQSQQLARTVEVVTAPDVVRVTMAGTPAAAHATGRGYWSQTRGVLFNADGLPALQTGRIYQLWIVLPNQAPISAGLLGVNANGSGSLSTAPPLGVAVPRAATVTMAITNEPGTGSPGPTTPILLAGNTRTE
jgi:anti-sigma-K factor RskA